MLHILEVVAGDVPKVQMPKLKDILHIRIEVRGGCNCFGEGSLVLLLAIGFFLASLKVVQYFCKSDHDQNDRPHPAEPESLRIQIVQQEKNSKHNQEKGTEHLNPSPGVSSTARLRKQPGAPAKTFRPAPGRICQGCREEIRHQ